MQTIFVQEPAPENELEHVDAGLANAPSVVNSSRPTRIVVCRAVQHGDVASSTNVVVAYRVHVVPDDIAEGEPSKQSEGKLWNQEIPLWISGALLDSLGEYFCPGNDDSAPSINNSSSGDHFATRHRLLAAESNCVLSVAASATNNRSRRENNACPGKERTSLCGEFDDSVRVTHTPECTATVVTDAITSYLRTETANKSVLQAANRWNVERGLTFAGVEFLEVSLPTVELGEQPVPAASKIEQTIYSDRTREGDMTMGGKLSIVLLSVSFVALLLLCFVIRRNEKQRLRRLNDDLRSIKTEWSLSSDKRRRILPDFHDLARRHVKLNVHHCNSAVCRVCRPHIRNVSMVTVPHGLQQSFVALANLTSQTMGNQRSNITEKQDTSSLCPSRNVSQSDEIIDGLYGLEEGMASTEPVCVGCRISVDDELKMKIENTDFGDSPLYHMDFRVDSDINDEDVGVSYVRTLDGNEQWNISARERNRSPQSVAL